MNLAKLERDWEIKGAKAVTVIKQRPQVRQSSKRKLGDAEICLGKRDWLCNRLEMSLSHHNIQRSLFQFCDLFSAQVIQKASALHTCFDPKQLAASNRRVTCIPGCAGAGL